MALPAGSFDRHVAIRLSAVVLATAALVILTCAALLFGAWMFQETGLSAQQRDQLIDFSFASGIVLAAAVVCCIPLGWIGARRLLRPLKAFRASVETANQRTMDRQVDLTEAQDDLSAIGGVLNQLFEKVESSNSQTHALTEAAALELKSALSENQRRAERLLPHASLNRESALMLGELTAETARLLRIVDGVLFLTKAGSGTLLVNMKHINLTELVDALARDASGIAGEHGIRIVVTRSAGGVQLVDEALLRQLFFNLLSNAIAVSPRDGTITIECFAGGGRWQLVMTDEGPGLPVDQHYRVFEPFVRNVHSEIASTSQGAGLGLTLCERIASLHGGTIRARNHSSGRGLRVTLAVPAQRRSGAEDPPAA